MLSAEGFTYNEADISILAKKLLEGNDLQVRIRGLELLAKSGGEVIEIGEELLRQLKKEQLYWLAKRVFAVFIEIDYKRLKHLKLAGLMNRYTGNYREALGLYDKALRIAQISDNPIEESNILNDIGVIHLESGEYQLAKEYFKRAHSLATEGGQRIRLLSNIGASNLLLRDFKSAEKDFRKALEIANMEENRRFAAVLHYNIGSLLTRTDRQEAMGELDRSIVISTELDLKRLLNLAFVQKAEIYMLNSEIELARHSLSDRMDILEVWMAKLKLNLVTGKKDVIEDTYREILRRSSSASLDDLEKISELVSTINLTGIQLLKKPDFLPVISVIKGNERLWLERGNPFLAAAVYYHHGESIGMEDQFDSGFPKALALLKNGLLLRNNNEPEKSRDSLLESRMIFAKLGNEYFLTKVDIVLDSLEKQSTMITGKDTMDILEMVNDIVEELDSELIISKILSKLLDLTGGERAILFLIDSMGRPIVEDVMTRKGRSSSEKVRYSRSVIRDVIAARKAIIRENVISDQELSTRDSVKNLDIRMVLASPLLEKDGLIGVIYIDSKIGSKPFGEAIISLVETLLKTAAIALSNSRNYEELKKENLTLRDQRRYEDIIGNSPAIEMVLRRMEIVAPEDISVLLIGETGTGKDLIARTIHRLSRRSDGPFIAINCAAVPENLLESELFGYEKGAFTGAVSRKLGRFEIADGGTVFLNEIGEMNPDLQAKLLSFLESRTFQRLGGLEDINTDIRIISATNVDMDKAISDGNFRSDLFYRLGRITISIPPLRKRREDIPDLVRYFAERFSEELGRDVKKIDTRVIRQLMMSDWPGNIRELKNTVEELVLFTRDGRIDDIPSRIETDLPLPENYRELKKAKDDIEKRTLENALKLHNWNIKQTAESFGINRTRLHQLINKHRLR